MHASPQRRGPQHPCGRGITTEYVVDNSGPIWGRCFAVRRRNTHGQPAALLFSCPNPFGAPDTHVWDAGCLGGPAGSGRGGHCGWPVPARVRTSGGQGNEGCYFLRLRLARNDDVRNDYQAAVSAAREPPARDPDAVAGLGTWRNGDLHGPVG